MTKKLLQTAFRVTPEPATKKPEPVQMGPRTDKPKGMSILDFVSRYATADELETLRAKIEARRRLEPVYRFWCCENSACRFRVRGPGDRDWSGSTCQRCNPRNLKGVGGTMREMTKKEVQAFLEDEKREWVRLKDISDKAELYRLNQTRQEKGNDPLDLPTFRKEREARQAAEWAAKAAVDLPKEA